MSSLIILNLYLTALVLASSSQSSTTAASPLLSGEVWIRTIPSSGGIEWHFRTLFSL
ncbi:MAG: hypothetical protein RQ842_03975 [Vulcanisaeta sp.]|nr:hypothetical protein [Vulcanisaeta sp.]